MSVALNIVILAAGQGKRMMSQRSKVLHPLAGTPMLLRVLAAAQSFAPRHLVVVVGHGAQQVVAALPSGTLTAVQAEQLGTGHAVAQALPQLDPSLPTVVLYGDVPCINTLDLQALIDTAGNDMAVLTAQATDPSGYGRMVLNDAGLITAIIEHKDCTAEQRESLREINTGVLLLPAHRAAQWLQSLQPNNVQKEYYLTDCVQLANAAGVPVPRNGSTSVPSRSSVVAESPRGSNSARLASTSPRRRDRFASAEEFLSRWATVDQ